MLMKEIKEDLSKWRDRVFMNWKTQHTKDVNSPLMGIRVTQTDKVRLTGLMQLLSKS